jgi:hypothetical protein
MWMILSDRTKTLSKFAEIFFVVWVAFLIWGLQGFVVASLRRCAVF